MRVPPVIGERWQVWAEDLRKYLGKAGSQLAAKEDGVSASEDGVILWDRANQKPTVSAGGSFIDLVTSADSIAVLADVTITAPSVGEVLKWDGAAWVNDTDDTGGGGGAPQIMSWVV